MMTALDRGTRALGQIARRGQLGYVLLLTVVVTATAAAGAYYLERDEPGASIGTPVDALWWAATIVTTINSPLETVTFEGRVIGLLLRVFALAISGYLTATIAVYLLGRPQSTAEQAEASELAELRREVRRLGALLERRLPEGGRAGGRDRVA
jgi:voltage-gated potassium channel